MAYDNTNKWAIWIKKAKSWLMYKSWILNVEGKEYNITMFDNDKQWNENRPDFNVIIEPADSHQNENNNLNNSNQKDENNDSSEISIEDIPF